MSAKCQKRTCTFMHDASAKRQKTGSVTPPESTLSNPTRQRKDNVQEAGLWLSYYSSRLPGVLAFATDFCTCDSIPHGRKDLPCPVIFAARWYYSWQ